MKTVRSLTNITYLARR